MSAKMPVGLGGATGLTPQQFETALAEVRSALNREGSKYVVVGAMAVQLWGSTRATRNVDILIEATVLNAERVLRALGQLGFGLAREWLAEEVARKPVTVIGETPRVDVLTVAWSVHYPEAAGDATVFEIEGVKIPPRRSSISSS